MRRIPTILGITLSTVRVFEGTYRLVLRLAPNLITPASSKGLDYGDTWRASGWTKDLYCPQGDMHMNAEGNRVLVEAIKDDVYQHLKK